MYDLILGVKSLANIGTILNFANATVTTDGSTLHMKDNHEKSLHSIRAQFRDLLEPKAMRKPTSQAVEISDTNYEKLIFTLL